VEVLKNGKIQYSQTFHLLINPDNVFLEGLYVNFALSRR
jgi:hypothetical protein